MNKLPVISGNIDSGLLSNQTIKLLRTIGSPLLLKNEPFVNGTESLELYDLAVKNKISLLYLESLRQQGKLNKLNKKYDEEYARYLNFLDRLGGVSNILESANIEYVIFKTIKPYPAVPGDVDIVVLGDNDTYKRVNRIFLESGYRYVRDVDNTSPTLPDLVNPEGDIVVDLQEELELSYVIYMDKNKFRGHIVKREITPGVEIKTLIPEFELATVIMHSLTEYLYLLGEFYTFLYSLARMNERDIDDFVAVLKENKITTVAKSFITITVVLHEAAYSVIPEKLEYVLDRLDYEKTEAERLLKNNFKMPHKYCALTVAKAILEKMGERRFMRSVLVQMVKMLTNPKLLKYMIGEVIEMRRREYYLKGME